MPDYKIYHLDGDGRIASAPQHFAAEDDSSAMIEAEGRRRGMPAELWQGGRLLARLPQA